MNRSQLVIPVVVGIAALTGACAAEVKTNVPAPQVAVAVPTVAVAAPVMKAEVVVAQPVVAAPAVEVVTPAEVVVKEKPPAVKVEVIPVAPSANHMWIQGNWHWGGTAWVWNPGHYEVKRVGLVWHPAQYVERAGMVAYVPGHWGH